MRRKKDRSNGITALYERLSRDDDNAGESNSIVHQKQMLEDYAIKHGFTNLVHFVDFIILIHQCYIINPQGIAWSSDIGSIPTWRSILPCRSGQDRPCWGCCR